MEALATAMPHIGRDTFKRLRRSAVKNSAISLMLVLFFACRHQDALQSDTADASSLEGIALPSFDKPPQLPSGRLFRFRNGGTGAKWGFVDSDGHVVIPPKYEFAADFQDGRALVCRSEAGVRTNAFIDDNDRIIFEFPSEDGASSFSEGLVWIRSERLRKWGCYDRDGKVVIPPKYDHISDFSEGLASVNIGGVREFPVAWLTKGGRWGYVDKSGREVIAICFDWASGFSGGLAQVRVGTNSLFIDVAGREVPAPRAAQKPRVEKNLPPEVVRIKDGRTMAVNDRREYRGELALVHLGGRTRKVYDLPRPWIWAEGAWYYVSRSGEVVVRMCEDSDDLFPNSFP